MSYGVAQVPISSKDMIMGAIRELVDEKKTIAEIKFQLSGIKTWRNPDDPSIVKEIFYHDALLNKDAVNELIAEFKTYLSPNIFLSWIGEEEIQTRCRQFDTNMTFFLSRNMINFEIDGKERMLKIKNMLGLHFRMALGRAYNALTLAKALDNIQIHEVRNHDENQQSQTGGFNRI